uniref:Uncharacterized protein n=1 Tax=Pararge aegeria TaxID=116150 RepID=S4P0S3_9NEOP
MTPLQALACLWNYQRVLNNSNFSSVDTRITVSQLTEPKEFNKLEKIQSDISPVVIEINGQYLSPIFYPTKCKRPKQQTYHRNRQSPNVPLFI